MKKTLTHPSFQLVVGSLLLVLGFPHITEAQTIPSNYVDIAPPSNVVLNRNYSMWYMSSPATSATPLVYLVNKYDISGVSDNPASGLATADYDFVAPGNGNFNVIGFSAGYLPVQDQNHVFSSTVVFRTSDNFSFHILGEMKRPIVTVTPQDATSDTYNAYTGKLEGPWSDMQAAEDDRFAIGMSFRFGYQSKWSFGATYNYYVSALPTGTFNLNSSDIAHAATVDLGAIHTDMDQDGNGTTWGIRFKNISFLKSLSTLHYSPHTTAQYESEYELTRYIPAYLALGGAYRYQLGGQQLAIGGECGLELNNDIPNASDLTANNRYNSIGAVKNMEHVDNLILTAHASWIKQLSDEWKLNIQSGYLADPYNRTPYLNADVGYHRFHFGVGYYLVTPEYGINQLSITMKTSL